MNTSSISIPGMSLSVLKMGLLKVGDAKNKMVSKITVPKNVYLNPN